jgi:hypothetical protein
MEATMQKQTRHNIDKTAENKYWQNQFRNESYYEAGKKFEDYEPAYRTGIEGYDRYSDTAPTFDAAEQSLKADYEKFKDQTELGWDKAKNAAKAAWHRLERAMPGDADRDGR